MVPGVATLWVGVAVTACSRAPEPVTVGYVYPPRAAPLVRLARAALAEPSGGAPVRIVYDSAGPPQEELDVEVERAQRLAQLPGLIAVIGPSSSAAALDAATIFNARRIPHIVPTSTSRLLAGVGPWTFAMTPDDSVEGAFLGRFVAERLHARRVLVFFANDEYGIGLAAGVRQALDAAGVRVLDEYPVDRGTDYPNLIPAVLTRGVPDVVVSAARPGETANIARALRDAGAPRAVVAGDGAADLGWLRQVAGAAADSIYVVAFWHAAVPDSASRAFVAAYHAATGGDPTWAEAMNWDALMLAARAVAVVGARPDAVRRYLASLGRDRPPYPGVTGPVAFTAPRATRLYMLRSDGQHLVPVPEP